MKLKEILAKVAKGEALTEDEKKFLAEYQEPDDGGTGDGGRIPKARLDKEIEKRKQAEAKTDELTTQLEDLKSKLEDLENADMSEAEKAKKQAEKDLAKLQKQVADLTKERDEAVSKSSALERSGKVRDLATKHHFTDADYLGFRLQQDEIDLNDDAAVSAFMKGLEKSAPTLFKSTAKPGTGTGTEGHGAPEPSAAKKRLEELNKKTELSSREIVEVAELAEKVKAEEAASGAASGANNNDGGADGAAGK